MPCSQPDSRCMAETPTPRADRCFCLTEFPPLYMGNVATSRGITSPPPLEHLLDELLRSALGAEGGQPSSAGAKGSPRHPLLCVTMASSGSAATDRQLPQPPVAASSPGTWRGCRARCTPRGPAPARPDLGLGPGLGLELGQGLGLSLGPGLRQGPGITPDTSH